MIERIQKQNVLLRKYVGTTIIGWLCVPVETYGFPHLLEFLIFLSYMQIGHVTLTLVCVAY